MKMLTQDEANVYDRQIRLWGVNSQRKIRQSKVLMLSFGGTASEVAKILVLAGIDKLTIVDDKPLQREDLTSNLFCRPDPSGEQHQYRTYATVDKLKNLNPLVNVSLVTIPIESLTEESFTGYDLVTLHTVLSTAHTNIINTICRNLRIKFYVAIDFGLFGFIFCDLGNLYSFVTEKKKTCDNQVELEKGSTQGNSIAITDDYNHISTTATSSSSTSKTDSLNNNNGNSIVRDAPKQDYDQPLKRMRLDAEKSETPNDTNFTLSHCEKKSDLKENEEIVSLSYSLFATTVSSMQESLTDRVSPIIVIVAALYKFFDSFNHLPRFDQKGEIDSDLQKLSDLVESIVPNQKTRTKIFRKLNEDWMQQLSGSWSPVCAVLGGVAGQDMIRVLSERDVPLYNTFTFDGLNMIGTVNLFPPKNKPLLT